MPTADGLPFAQALIEKERIQRTGTLDLRHLGLEKLPDELGTLTHLTELLIGNPASWEGPESRVGFGRNSLSAGLAILAKLVNLQSLSCSGTQVSDLGPLRGLTGLQSLDCSNTLVQAVPDELLAQPTLRELSAHGCPLDGIPPEVIATINCLVDLRAHVADRIGGTEALLDVKMLVLGNGKAGKTQLVNRLSDKPFNPQWDSTHGVQIGVASLPATPPLPLRPWDFGGQDIYHGTHALFARGVGLFLVVWATDTENDEHYTDQGITFRNQPLPYWLAQARHFAGTSNPVLVVQTKCDRFEQERRLPPPAEALLAALPYGHPLAVSSANDRGLPALIDRMRDAVAWSRAPERGGVPTIGLGRLAVRRRIEALQDEDRKRRVEERQHRWLDLEAFQNLCRMDGRISDSDAFLRYLHNAGVVFHEPRLFHGRIILDQQWALDAVYAVFNRERCYRQIRGYGGRFNLPLLGELVWQDHSQAERELLVSMMQSCGICFQIGAPGGWREYAEYVAPDLLPGREHVATTLADRWDGAAGEIREHAFELPLMHGALVRALTCRIGEQAQFDGLYWRCGVYAYDSATRSRAVIEHLEGSKTVWLRTRGGAAGDLFEQLAGWIAAEAGRLGLDLPESRRRPMPPGPETGAAPPAEAPAFGPEPRQKRSFFVSYAWASNEAGATEVERQRERVVDRLQQEAERRGIRLQRDKVGARFGNLITDFMNTMIEGDRIAVILSDKYLRSFYCMYELCGIWQRCHRNQDEFRKRVRVFALPDARFSSARQRQQIAIHWKEEYEAIDEGVHEHGASILGDDDLREHRLIGEFRAHVSNILATIADMLRPVTEEDFLRWTLDDMFDDLEPGR